MSKGNVLTKREMHILSLLSRGRTSRQISEELGISFNTVEVHRTNIRKKLGVHNVADLMLSSIRKGLIKIEREERMSYPRTENQSKE
jgi:DNA-binding NarL/FixJ family response regulator